MSYEEQILIEVKQMPEEQLENLLRLIRLFRESVSKSVAARTSQTEEGSLHGTVLRYDDPFGPATPLEDWEVLQ